MEKTDLFLVVCDAGPVIHLDELNSLDLLRGFRSIIIPPYVWGEIIHHRPQLDIARIPAARIVRSETAPSPKLVSLADAFSLDTGERDALLLAEAQPVDLFLTDDAAARLAAESLGLAVHGSLGILLRAIRLQYRTHKQILELLAALPQRSTLYISRALLETVITHVKADQTK